MIPILFKSDEVDFITNGVGLLNDIYGVDVQEQRNGLLTLTASYPTNAKHYKDIEAGRIIYAKPNPLDGAQAFRIVKTELDISGYNLNIEADHITYDLTHNLVKSVHLQGDGQNAMTHLQNATVTPHLFRFISDLQHEGDSTLKMVNPMEAIAGTEGSILQIWGGELKRDNRTVSMLSRRGRDNFTTFRLGKNINGLKYTVDMSNVVTRIIPTVVRSNDESSFIVGNTVDSKNITKYPNAYLQHVDMGDKITIADGDTDEAIKAKIDAKSKGWFTQSANSGIDLPQVTVEIDVTSLQDSADYQDKFRNLESVGLTDTVSVYVPEFGVNVTAIVNELHYDPLTERVTSLVVGTSKKSFADNNSNALAELQNKITQIRQDATTAIVSSNGKNTNYYGTDEPKHPVEGDLWFKQVGDETYLMIFKDGRWQEWVSTKTQEKIAKAVDDAIKEAQKYTDELNDKQSKEYQEFQADTNKKLDSAASERQQLSSAATSMANSASSHADSVATSAAAYGKAQAASALSNANKALDKAKTDLTTAIGKETADRNKAVQDVNSQAQEYVEQAKTDLTTVIGQEKTDRTKAIQDVNSQAQEYVEQAKTDLTTSINKEVTDRNKAVSAANSQAQGYAAQAKSDAIEAAKKADGQVRKDFTETADALSSTIEQNKSDADGKISTAQTTATQALEGLKTKVSQTDFNEKTGKLTTDLTTTMQTSNQAKLDIASVKSEADSQSAQINDIVSDAKGTKQTISDIKTEQGKQSGSINQLESRAEGFAASITKINDLVNAQGQVNQLMNTEFSPDLEGWNIGSDTGSNNPYRSYWDKSIQAFTVGFNTVASSENTFAKFIQTVQLSSSPVSTGYAISLSWYAWGKKVDNYNNLWVRFFDDSNNKLGESYTQWAKSDDKMSNQQKWENVEVPQGATNVQIQFYAREGTLAYLARPMLVLGSTIGGYVQGNYNNNGALAKVKLTADQASLDLSNYKTNADGRISKAQSDISANATAIATKVSQSDYNAKTNDLTTKVNTVTQTANETKNELADISKTVDSQSAKINTISNTVDGTKQTISNIQTEQGKQSGSINQLETRADGFDAKIQSISDSVNAQGQVNQLMNTEFNPDLEGWTLSAGDGSRTPFKSSFNSTVQANIVGFNTLDSTENTYAVLRQDITIGSATGGYVSLSWQAYAQTFANYANLWVMFYDVDGNKLDQQFKEWTPQKSNGSTTGAWNRQKFEGIVIPAKTVNISVQFQAREGMLAYVARPMLVFDKTIGSYVQGNYNNNGSLAKVKLTAEQAGLDLSNYKTSADGRISKAQADITATAKEVGTKVSQSDYDKKTNQLTTDVNHVTQTATETKNELASVSKTVDSQSTKINTISNTVNGTKQTISNIQTEQGKQSGSINKLETRADGFDAKIQAINDAVNADGQINQLMNTEFSPDLEGWDTFDTNTGSSVAYISSANSTYGSRSVGFNTKNASANTYSRFRQNIFLTRPNNVVVSFSWRSFGTQVDNYNNLFIRFYDGSDNLIDYKVTTWSTVDNRWDIQKIENISVPDTTVRLQVSFEAREGTLAYILQPMLVFDDHVGEYVQGNYNNNAKVAEVKLTADKATLDLKNYKTSNDGRISSAESNITAAKNELAGKVSQSDFNAKTNDLTTKYGQVKATADSVTIDVNKYKQLTDGRIGAAESGINVLNKQILTKVSQTDFDKRTQTVDSKFATQQLSVDKINQSVSELQAKANAQGQINQLLNTEFTPDLENWDTSDTNATSSPAYVSSVVAAYGSRSVGFNTKDAAANTYSRFRQNVALTRPNNVVLSFSWRSYSTQVDNYNNLFIRFYDSSDNLVDYTSRTWSTATSRWEIQKIENIAVPDTTARVQISFEAREGTLAYVLQPMLVFDKTVGSYIPGSYNNNNRVAATEIAIDSITSLVKDPTKGLSATWNLASNGQTIAVAARTNANTANANAGKAQTTADNAQRDATTAITTAKGIQTQVTSNDGDIKDLKSVTTQTASQVTAEVVDRKSGDSAVRTEMANLIDQRIKDTKSGYETYFSQQAQGIIAGVSTPNQLFNSGFTPDLASWDTINSGLNGKNYNFFRSSLRNGVAIVGINVPADAGDDTNKWFSQLNQDVAVSGNDSGSVMSISWDVRTVTNANYMTLWIRPLDANHNVISNDLNVSRAWSSDVDGQWHSNKIENVAIPSEAKFVRISFQAREGSNAYLTKPMLTFTAKAMDYMPGSYSDVNTSTVLRLLKDNWGIGLADNIGKITSGIVGDAKSMSLISNNVTIESPNTQITGKTWITSAMIKDGAIGHAQIGNAAVGSAQIINLDVAKLSGNIANFITGNINTLNSHVLYGDTGHLTTVDTGLIINRQDDHLQLSSKGLYNFDTKRSQLELLNYADNVDENMRGSLNYYKNPHNKGTGLGIRLLGNQILAIDEAVSTGNLYLSPYASGQVQVVNRNRNGFQDIKASKFVTSSERKYKSQIKNFNDNALELVNSLKIRKYIKNDEDEIGIIADETDERILDKANTGVDLYSFVSVVAKAVQELTEKVGNL